jgi:hypothetical protein
MKFKAILILLPALTALASCVQNDPGACAGLEPNYIAAATAEYLAAHDPQALAGMIAYFEYGQRMGCWD